MAGLLVTIRLQVRNLTVAVGIPHRFATVVTRRAEERTARPAWPGNAGNTATFTARDGAGGVPGGGADRHVPLQVLARLGSRRDVGRRLRPRSRAGEPVRHGL